MAGGSFIHYRNATVAELVRRFEAGASLSQLADTYGMPPSAVGEWLVDAKVPLRPSRRGQPRKELPGVADLYAAGMSLRALATRYGVASSTVRKRLVEAGVTLRPAGWNGQRKDHAEHLTRPRVTGTECGRV